MFLYALEKDETNLDGKPMQVYFCFLTRKFMVLSGGCQTQLHARLSDVEHYQAQYPESRIVKCILELR